MNERHRNHGVDLSTYHQYRGSSLNVVARALLYDKYAAPRLSLREEMIRSLDLSGDEAVLDTGCGDGAWLRLLADRGHTGQLVGVNDAANVLAAGREVGSYAPNLRLLEMDARYLDGIPDDTFDVASSQHLYYHIDDYETAIEELKRVAKPEAKILVATKGDFNQIRIWQGLKLIEPHIPPPNPGWPAPMAPETFYTHFDLEDAGDILGEYFEVMPELSVKQQSILRIPEDGWDDYKLAMLSLKDSFHPIPRYSDISDAIDSVYKPIFDREITAKGYYTDYVQQGFFVCRNRK